MLVWLLHMCFRYPAGVTCCLFLVVCKQSPSPCLLLPSLIQCRHLLPRPPCPHIAPNSHRTCTPSPHTAFDLTAVSHSQPHSHSNSLTLSLSQVPNILEATYDSATGEFEAHTLNIEVQDVPGVLNQVRQSATPNQPQTVNTVSRT